jgi:subtilisin-like proprotein convertase family protein
VSDLEDEGGTMTVQTVRRLSEFHLHCARAVRLMLPLALLVALAGERAIGQGPTPTISIGDVTIAEGNSGIALATFDVTLANPNATESRVSFTTTNGTATGGIVPRPFMASGPFAIPDGTGVPVAIPIAVTGVTQSVVSLSLLIQNVAHPAAGDLDLLLVSPDGKRVVVQSDAIGIPLNGTVSYGLKDGETPLPSNGVPGFNSPTSYAPADVFGAPAPSGPHPEAAPAGSATLNGTFRGIVPDGVWTLYVQDDTAGNQGSIGAVALLLEVPEPGTDFAPAGGVLRFPPGTTTQTLTVPIYGDTTVEPNETFSVDLASAINAVISDAQATGTIMNDDGGGGGTRPTALDDTYHAGTAGLTIPASGGVLANDNSNGGGPLSAVLVTSPIRGTLTLNADGGFSYIKSDGAAGGTDSFTYRAVNAAGDSNVATVTIVFDRPPAPTNLTARVVGPANPVTGGRSAILRWNESFFVPRATDHEIAGGVRPGETLASVRTNSPYPIATLENLPTGGSFVVWVRALVGNESSDDSNVIPLHNTTAVAPSAPVNLLGAVDGSNLTLAWRNTYTGGIPTNTFLRVTGDANVTVPLGETETFSYAGVPAGTYTFTVLNGNAGGLSAPANSFTGTFPGTCTPPQMPENLLVYLPSILKPTTSTAAPSRTPHDVRPFAGSLLGAIWDLPLIGASPSGYQLNITSSIFTGSLPITQNSISGPVPPGSYTISVSATNACGVSPPTPAQTVTVP